MPNFFLPGIEDREKAEIEYQNLIKHLGGNKPDDSEGRLYSIGFLDRGKAISARVGEEITNFRDISGIVLAITESRGQYSCIRRVAVAKIPSSSHQAMRRAESISMIFLIPIMQSEFGGLNFLVQLVLRANAQTEWRYGPASRFVEEIAAKATMALAFEQGFLI
ncbi:MAG: hypothetical protein OEN23_19255 [Paracoccaceae bacterium]|nr:hypothetical protein [Paracoccaceae bacterium]